MYRSHQLSCPRESTRAARQPPLHPRPARKRSEARAPAGQLAVDETPRQRAAARQELGVPAFRAYPSGLQTLTETAAVCADNLRTCRERVLGEFRSRCTCMQRSKVCYAMLRLASTDWYFCVCWAAGMTCPASAVRDGPFDRSSFYCSYRNKNYQLCFPLLSMLFSG